jgi:hypothetical protein
MLDHCSNLVAALMQGAEAGKGIGRGKAAQGKVSRVFLRAGREIEGARVGSRCSWEVSGTRKTQQVLVGCNRYLPCSAYGCRALELDTEAAIGRGEEGSHLVREAHRRREAVQRGEGDGADEGDAIRRKGRSWLDVVRGCVR